MEDEDLLELQDEEFYEDDDPIETQLNEELEMLEKARDQQTQKSSRRKKRDNESLCSDEYNGSLNIPSNGRGFKMKQEVLISILYLGLRWLNEPITANDLSRWIQEGKLPYHKASDVLPRHMKFAGSDHIYLCSRQNVKPMKISFFAIQIVRLLRLKDFPKPNLQLLTARLIVDLDLPVYFHTLVKLLMKISHFSPEFGTSYGRKFVQKCFYLDEAIAAYIVVAVKLVYFLDGERERRGDIRVFLSRLTETPIESYYSWAHRVFLTRKRKYQFGVPMIQDHLQYVQSAKNYSAFCAREVFTSWQPREVTTNSQCTLYKHVRACLGDKKELYHQIFTSLVPELEKKIEEMKSEQSEPSSFPSGVQHLKEVYEDTPMDYIPDKVAARMDTRDVSEGYVRYLCAVGNRVFSESYEFLLETIAERISLLSSELQKFVEFVEDDLFRRARKQTPKEKNE